MDVVMCGAVVSATSEVPRRGSGGAVTTRKIGLQSRTKFELCGAYLMRHCCHATKLHICGALVHMRHRMFVQEFKKNRFLAQIHVYYSIYTDIYTVVQTTENNTNTSLGHHIT
jgi:hypothetical protein